MAPITPHRCPGCGEWHDVLGQVLWGDSTAWLCGKCLNEDQGYRWLRIRPESLHLHWSLPVERSR
jgi:hypothetical protein